MVMNVYSAKDTKAGIYHQPFYCRHEAEAIRMFTGAANDPNTNIATYPGDFELHKLGEWNDFSGQFENLETPKFVINGVTAKNLNKQINQMIEGNDR